MSTLIHQTIPEKHIQSFLEKGHYFKPCCDFKDKVEFRYGYCLFNFHSASARDLAKCVRLTRSIAEVNRWIASTRVSCWVRNMKDEPRMWKEHGGDGPAIRISVNVSSFLKHAKSETGEIASGNVTYGGMIAVTYSPFLARWELGDATDAIYHLFFHKRLKFEWEQEFRVVLFSERGPNLKMVPEMIDSVEVSPLGKIDATLRSELRDMFGNRLIESEDDRKTLQSRHSGGIDETITSDKLRSLTQELHRLEARSAIVGKGWNDPKTPRSQIKRTLKLAKQIFETTKAIQAERMAMLRAG